MPFPGVAVYRGISQHLSRERINWPPPEHSARHAGPPMNQAQPNNPLHGLTLEMILTQLVAWYGWDDLGRQIDIRCFNHEPSIASSLKFLRRTPWARQRVEALYLDTVGHRDG